VKITCTCLVSVNWSKEIRSGLNIKEKGQQNDSDQDGFSNIKSKVTFIHDIENEINKNTNDKKSSSR